MINIKKVNLNAPRFRRKVYRTVNKELITNLKLKVHNCENFTDAELENIIKTFNRNVYNTVVDVRDGVELPAQLGHLFIGTCQAPIKRYNMDIKTSLEYMTKIKHRNFESDQHLAKIFYTNFSNKYRFKNHELWAFDAAREFKQKVAYTYCDNWKKYIEVDPRKKIGIIFQSAEYKLNKKRDNNSLLDQYNEFDL